MGGDEEPIALSAQAQHTDVEALGGFSTSHRGHESNRKLIIVKQGKKKNPNKCAFPHFVEPEEMTADPMGARKQPSPANLTATVDISTKMRFYQSVQESICWV